MYIGEKGSFHFDLLGPITYPHIAINTDPGGPRPHLNPVNARPVSPPEPAVHSRGVGMAESDMSHKRQLENDEADRHYASKPVCCYLMQWNTHIFIMCSITSINNIKI